MNNVFKQVVIVAAEIIVKSCSCVLLDLLTTGKADSYVTMAAVHQILTVSKALWAGQKRPVGQILSTP